MKAKLSDLEVEDLVRHLFQLEGEDDYDALDVAIFEEWGVDLPTFYKICEHLVPLCQVGTSPITGKQYRGFAAKGSWLVKEEVPSENQTG